MAPDKLPKWDVQSVRRMVLSRLDLTHDAITRLMKEESDLERTAGPAVTDRLKKMRADALHIEALGGDAAAVWDSHRALESRLDELGPKLTEVQSQLATAREYLKWIDYAAEGLHWACFADSRFQELLDADRALATNPQEMK